MLIIYSSTYSFSFQSPYFASMFSGSWNESNKQEIEIQIPNPTITKKSIHIVLGSLYQPNISFDHEDIFSVIAAATLFQLDDLVTRCEDILIKSISCEVSRFKFKSNLKLCTYSEFVFYAFIFLSLKRA